MADRIGLDGENLDQSLETLHAQLDADHNDLRMRMSVMALAQSQVETVMAVAAGQVGDEKLMKESLNSAATTLRTLLDHMQPEVADIQTRISERQKEYERLERKIRG